ncbi:MAG: hypothetical protein WAN21_00395, partial [Candidatus Sulfotelmatobacter sp.]
GDAPSRFAGVHYVARQYSILEQRHCTGRATASGTDSVRRTASGYAFKANRNGDDSAEFCKQT